MLKLSRVQRLAILGMDDRNIGAVRTDSLGWVWRSDCFFSKEAAEAVALRLRLIKAPQNSEIS